MKRSLYTPREISWLSFNDRVLQEAADETNPLFERIKFLGICSNNLDEFFRVRVAVLNRVIAVEDVKNLETGEKPKKLLKNISKAVLNYKENFEAIYDKILSLLAEQNIFIVNEKQLTDKQGVFVNEYFNTVLRQYLFPIMLNSIKDVELLNDYNPYLAVILRNSKKHGKVNYALIQIPSAVPRFLILPEEENKKRFIILIDDVIRFCYKEIFSIFGYDSYDSYEIKFTRDSELDFDSDISKSFLETISESLKQRKVGRPTRFTYDETMPDVFFNYLLRKLRIQKETDTIIAGGRYHNFCDFMKFPSLGIKKLEYQQLPAIQHKALNRNFSMFSAIKQKDILLNFPYHTFQYIIDFLREASIDPKVKTIKATIYRAAQNSGVLNALINASKNGKKVTVMMEIQARFDENANIVWAGKLQDEGIKIIDSKPGFKVHAKLILVGREENKEMKHYASICTGNFNEENAKFYSDFNLFTCDKEITKEVHHVFDMLETTFKSYKFKHLLVSPVNMRQSFIRMINNEIFNAKSGHEAWIIIKLNNLVDHKISEKLYEAGKAGVKIKIIARSTCVLVPGIEGVSDNIECISIVDHFLEHARVTLFCNGGDEKLYISSADWMVRNFDYRVEVACPVLDKSIRDEIIKILKIQLSDNTKARIISKDKTNDYKRIPKEPKVRSQIEIYNYYKSQLS